MADWTNLPNAAVGVGGLPSGTTVTALRDNPIAISEGAAGAPRLRVGALQRLSPGAQVRARRDAEMTATDGISFAFLQSGMVRVTFEHRDNATFPGSASVVRRRNGVETVLATWANTNSYVARTLDASVLPGDFLQVRNYGGGATPYLRNQRISTDGEDLFPGSEAYLEGNTYA